MLNNRTARVPFVGVTAVECFYISLETRWDSDIAVKVNIDNEISITNSFRAIVNPINNVMSSYIVVFEHSGHIKTAFNARNVILLASIGKDIFLFMPSLFWTALRQ